MNLFCCGLFFLGHVGIHLGPHDVQNDGEEDQNALGDDLPVGVGAQQVEAVVDHADDKAADQRAQHVCTAAGERGAADDDSRDGIHLGVLAGRDLRGSRAGGEDDRGNGDIDAHCHVDAQTHFFSVDAGHARRFGVTAHRDGMTAKHGAGEQDIHDEHHQGHDVDRHRDGADIALPEEHKAGGQVGDRHHFGDEVSAALVHRHGGQRDDEGGQVKQGDDRGVQRAAQRAGDDAHEDGHRHRQAGLHGFAHDDAHKAHHAADGQIHVAGAQHQREAGAHDRAVGDLAHHVEQVVGGEENGGGECHDQDQRQQDEESPIAHQQLADQAAFGFFYLCVHDALSFQDFSLPARRTHR